MYVLFIRKRMRTHFSGDARVAWVSFQTLAFSTESLPQGRARVATLQMGVIQRASVAAREHLRQAVLPRSCMYG